MLLGLGLGLGAHAQTAAPVAQAEPAAAVARVQTAAPGESRLPPELAWRIEVLFRSKVTLPVLAVVHVGPRSASEIAGYDQVSVSYSAGDATSQPIRFLLSRDGKTLVQFNRFDIGADPRMVMTGSGRPGRGGGETAPVSIVVFDDLECPFCARLNATMFPAVLDRYKDAVRVVSMDLPSSGHPWAMRAAVDTACLAKESPVAYWDAVDAIHLHAGELGGKDRSLKVAEESLDAMVQEAGREQGLDSERLQACVAKQDASSIEASVRRAEALGIEQTPTLFVNGARVEGAVPKEFLFQMIDAALVARGRAAPEAGQ
jgi:protein-disulfide isomerase